MSSIVQHVVQAGIRASDLADLSVDIPPLPTQRKIAAVLGAFDDKIENNRKICANLEVQAQAIFKSWFVDFEPFGGKMPQGWKMGKLGDVAECNQDSYLAKDGWAFVNYLDTGSITRNQIQDIQEIPMSEAPSRARRKVRKLSIVYSTVRPNQCHYGIIHDVKEHMLVSTGFAVIDAKESFSPYRIFLELTQDCVTRQLQVLAEQSVCTYPALNPSDILAREIVIPEFSVEQRFDSVIRPMFEQMELANQESRALAAMRDALLPKLMSGEIDVEKVQVA
jgi:type I restriction enzyme S subunit